MNKDYDLEDRENKLGVSDEEFLKELKIIEQMHDQVPKYFWYVFWFFMFTAIIALWLDKPGENDRTSYMSPCQCLFEHCNFLVKKEFAGLYQDGTDPGDYDIWGKYSGTVDVPTECRVSGL